MVNIPGLQSEKKVLQFVLMKYYKLRVTLFTNAVKKYVSLKMPFDIILSKNMKFQTGKMTYQDCRELKVDHAVNFRKPLLPHIYIQYTEILCISQLVRKLRSEHKVSLSQ